MKPFVSFIVGIIITLLLLWQGGLFQKEETYTQQPDTVYIKKPYKEVIIKRVEVPVKVEVYPKDTAYRKELEKDTLVTSVEITKNLTKIHSLTPEGLPIINTYATPDFKKMKINHEGQLEVKKEKHPKRKKVLKTIGRIGIFVGGVIIGAKLFSKSPAQ